MLSPVWLQLTGIDEKTLWIRAGDVATVEDTPEGSRLLVGERWIYVTEPPVLIMESLSHAGDWSVEATIRIVKEILDSLVGVEDEAVN